MQSRKAILPDWLKYVVIGVIFLIITIVIAWQLYNGGLGIINNPSGLGLGHK